MSKVLKFHDTGATLTEGDSVLRVFGWPRDGGHVWEIVGDGDRQDRRNICYPQSRNTVLTEETPHATALRVADVCGVDRSAVAPRYE